MLPDTPFMLTLLLLLVAFIVAARTALAWAALERLSTDVRARGVDLEERSVDLAGALGQTRAGLATANATIEHTLWALPRFDARLDMVSTDVRTRRAQLDELRIGPLTGAGSVAAQARSTARLVLRLATLRRKMLG